MYSLIKQSECKCAEHIFFYCLCLLNISKLLNFYLTFVKNIQKLTNIFLVQIFIFLGSLYSLLTEIKRVRKQRTLAVTWTFLKGFDQCYAAAVYNWNELLAVEIMWPTYTNGQFRNCQSWSLITVHGQYNRLGLSDLEKCKREHTSCSW